MSDDEPTDVQSDDGYTDVQNDDEQTVRAERQ